jgi:hypothetical protein
VARWHLAQLGDVPGRVFALMAFKINVPPGYTIVAGRGPLGKVLRAAGNEVAAKARQAIRAGAATKKRKAKRAAKAGGPPVGRTGNLARNIKVRVWRKGEGVSIVDTALSAGGSHAPYALFLEKGAVGGISSFKKDVKGRSNQRKKIGRKSVMVAIVGRRVLAPHPFMEPALDQVVASGLSGRVRAAVVSGMAFRRA